MFKFVIKGLLRGRSRSFFPVLIVLAGVMLNVFLAAWMSGYTQSMLRQNARFETGHVKIVTNSYAQNIALKPYDLGFVNIKTDLDKWKKAYPQIRWTPRIYFGALLDVPDKAGNTLEQGNVFGMAIDLGDASAVQDLHLTQSIIKGRMPQKANEILVSDSLFNKLHLKLNSRITLLGSTLYGAMSFLNCDVCGTVSFGISALDQGGIIANLDDIRVFLDMLDGASEILGFFPSGEYNEQQAQAVKSGFNKQFNTKDDFAPTLLTLSDQNNLGFLIRYMDFAVAIMLFVFISIISIVLWNAGLMNGIRRYGEFGLRLAMGERKTHLYGWLLMEALAIGLTGSVIGALIGCLISWYFHIYGIDMSAFSRSSSILMENIIYTNTSVRSVLLSIMQGIVSTLIGAMLAGIGIFGRKTSQLFKELET